MSKDGSIFVLVYFCRIKKVINVLTFWFSLIQGCIQKFLDWVDNKTNTLTEKQHRGLWQQNSLDWLKTAIQLHLVAESCTICSSCSRWLVWKLLDTPLYIALVSFSCKSLYETEPSISCAPQPLAGKYKMLPLKQEGVM